MASHPVLKEQLIEMGFDDNIIGKALSLLGEKATIESTIEYIEGLINGTVDSTSDDNKDQKTSDSTAAEGNSEETDKTVVSEEERERKRLEYEEKIKIRRKEREVKEKEEELQREIKRREDGKGVGKMKEELEQLQRIKVAEEMRREKAEAKAAKDAILAQIARDREEQRRARQDFATPVQTQTPVVTPLTSSAAKDGKCKLAIRLLDGSQLINEFDGRESLSAVRVYVITQSGAETNITFVMPPLPPFTEEDMEKPLTALGLCPSARVHVIRR